MRHDSTQTGPKAHGLITPAYAPKPPGFGDKAPHNTEQEGHNTTPFRSVISTRITRLLENSKINYNNTGQYPKAKKPK